MGCSQTKQKMATQTELRVCIIQQKQMMRKKNFFSRYSVKLEDISQSTLLMRRKLKSEEIFENTKQLMLNQRIPIQ